MPRADFKASGRWEKHPLFKEWEAAYTTAFNPESNEWLNEADYRSLCVGWCVAKGLSIDEALDFYSGMIAFRLF